MKKTYIIQKSGLYKDVFADVIETLAELAQNKEIPAWGSYDTDMITKIYPKIERSHPIIDYYISLHAGPTETPGPVVATAYIHTMNDTAEVTVFWND